MRGKTKNPRVRRGNCWVGARDIRVVSVGYGLGSGVGNCLGLRGATEVEEARGKAGG